MATAIELCYVIMLCYGFFNKASAWPERRRHLLFFDGFADENLLRDIDSFSILVKKLLKFLKELCCGFCVTDSVQQFLLREIRLVSLVTYKL